ncbi:hypothetical protein [Streptomyces sp. NPDC023327]|uniref:hypothetical protein n=1 Tax=Streptomyces sp. NPDC023327 TaxID=3157088 RepID=UPI0033E224E5
MTPTDMGPTHVPSGRRRRTLVTVPASAESVPQRPQQVDPRRQPYQQPLPQQAYQQPRRPQPHQPPRQQPYEQSAYEQSAYEPQTYQQPFQQQSFQPHAPQQSRLPQPPHQDPPIYRALLRHWSDRDRTLPGRHDPEWARLVTPTVALGQFSGTRDPRGDGR